MLVVPLAEQRQSRPLYAATAGVIGRQRRWRTPPTGGIENWQGGHGILLPRAADRARSPTNAHASLADPLPLRPGTAEAGGSLTRRPTLVLTGSDVGPSGTPPSRPRQEQERVVADVGRGGSGWWLSR